MHTDVFDLTLKVGDKVMIPGWMAYTWTVIGFILDEALLSKSGYHFDYACPCRALIKIYVHAQA